MRVATSRAFVLSILATANVGAAAQTVAERDGQCSLAGSAVRHVLLAASSEEEADLAWELSRQSLAVMDNFCSVQGLTRTAEPVDVRSGLPSVTPASPDDVRSAAGVLETIKGLKDISVSRYSTPTFVCAVDYDTCEVHSSETSDTGDALLACGFSFLACMGQQLAAVPE